MHRKYPAAPPNAMRSALPILPGDLASYTSTLKTPVGNLDRNRVHSIGPRLEIFATGPNFIGTFIDQLHHDKGDEFLLPPLRRNTSETHDALRELQFDQSMAAERFKY